MPVPKSISGDSGAPDGKHEMLVAFAVSGIPKDELRQGVAVPYPRVEEGRLSGWRHGRFPASQFGEWEGRVNDLFCSACGSPVSPHDGVSVGFDAGTKFMCSRCYNELVAENRGLDFEHVTFAPLTLQDVDGVHHTFQFRSNIFSDQLSLTALETGTDKGYEFCVIADAEQDLFITFKALFERIRRELGRKHIEPEGNGYRITRDDVVRGQITDDPNSLGQLSRLIIDGKAISWEELGRMVAPYAGFGFKLEIFDRGEER
jgi:hypothetical protein